MEAEAAAEEEQQQQLEEETLNIKPEPNTGDKDDAGEKRKGRKAALRELEVRTDCSLNLCLLRSRL